VRVPKALVEVGGVTQLDRTLRRLVDAGCDRIVVNVHHHAGLIERHLDETCPVRPATAASLEPAWDWNGSQVVLSREEEEPLDTGGGIRWARRAFRGGHTILVHNVDVISAIDLPGLVEAQEGSGALATLAVQRREASRYLVFDESGLCGRVDTRTGEEQWARRVSGPSWTAGFTGIHALGPELPSQLTESGAFPIMNSYLRLAAAGGRIQPFDATGALWLDMGTPDRLASARRMMGPETDS
jgi:NDP-sugar pyrophosphorylase family protein